MAYKIEWDALEQRLLNEVDSFDALVKFYADRQDYESASKCARNRDLRFQFYAKCCYKFKDWKKYFTELGVKT